MKQINRGSRVASGPDRESHRAYYLSAQGLSVN